MGDKNDADPARAEPAHHGEQLCDLVYVRAGSGFVEYQDACRQVDGTGNRRQVLHRDRKLAEWARYIDLAIDGDRKSVVSGRSVYVSVDLGGRRIIKKKTKLKAQTRI